MSERELQRIEVLSKVLERRMTVASAAQVLELTARQVQRLVKRFRADGAGALRHKARGQPSNHRYAAGVADLAVQLVREHYIDFGPTLAAEKLSAKASCRARRCANGCRNPVSGGPRHDPVRPCLVGTQHRDPVRQFKPGKRANVFLPAFMADFNERFAKVPARPDNLHRALNIAQDRLRDVLCKRELRCVSQQLSFSYERRQIMLEKNGISIGLVGKYVDIYEFSDGWIDVRWKACSLPYTVFDKEQRVTHTAITENKRLGEVLSWIKSAQEEAWPAPKIKTNSEQNAYKTRGTKPGRRTDFMNDPTVIARREQALARLAAAE